MAPPDSKLRISELSKFRFGNVTFSRFRMFTALDSNFRISGVRVSVSGFLVSIFRTSNIPNIDFAICWFYTCPFLGSPDRFFAFRSSNARCSSCRDLELIFFQSSVFVTYIYPLPISALRCTTFRIPVSD